MILYGRQKRATPVNLDASLIDDNGGKSNSPSRGLDDSEK